jgi:hypothetical protein
VAIAQASVHTYHYTSRQRTSLHNKAIGYTKQLLFLMQALKQQRETDMLKKKASINSKPTLPVN